MLGPTMPGRMAILACICASASVARWPFGANAAGEWEWWWAGAGERVGV